MRPIERLRAHPREVAQMRSIDGSGAARGLSNPLGVRYDAEPTLGTYTRLEFR
jgi:hypothetical protein